LAISSINQTVGAESAVQIRDNFFSPNQRNIAPNDSVRWVNQGNSPHTTTSNTGLWDSGTLNHGDAFSVTFSNVGSYPYFCQIHGQAMSGTINVTTNSSAVPSNLFLVNVSGSVRSTNALGKIVLTPEKTKDLVADCAGDHQLNPADLSLVYDRQADAIKVVKNSDGSTVCTMMTFAGGANVIAADGKRKERQAFVFWEDSQEANGSMVGTEMVTRDAAGALLKFSLHGSIQFGLEMYEDEPPSVFQGTFSTGRQFVPRM
jgi:plastocyanin